MIRVGADLSVRPQNRLRSGEDRRTHRSAPTEIGVTAFDEWNCRADVACVGADLSVRPQNRLRSGEDRRTHRSAPTKGYTYHRYTSSASVVDKAKRVTRCRDARSERPLYQKLQHRSFNDNGRTDRASLQRVTRFALTQWTHDHESIQILVLQHLMAGFVVLM